MSRTAQDLLAERRALVLEQSRETDRIASEVLQFEIDQIDRSLKRFEFRVKGDKDGKDPNVIETIIEVWASTEDEARRKAFAP